MVGTPTRCGFCGRQTVTTDGRCPECGRGKRPPPAPLRPPAPPPSLWREFRAQIAAAAVGALLVVTAIVMFSTVALVAIGVALAVLLLIWIVTNGVP